MIEITPQDVLAFFGAIACIGGGAAYLMKLFHWIMHPNNIQNKKLKEHDDLLKSHSEFLDKDKRKIEKLEEQDRLVMQALLVLIDHGIDGNNIEEMKSCKKSMEDFLISK